LPASKKVLSSNQSPSCTYSLKVLQLSPDVNASFLFYTKFEIIQLPREESAVKSNVK